MIKLSKSNAKRTKPHSEVLTIMMMDLCDYTELSSKLRRETLDELHDIFDNLTIPVVNAHNGDIVKKIGDAFLITFKSPTDALLSAIEIQKAFRRYNKAHGLKENPINVKIALHTGEVILKKEDIYGDAVNLASRIESIAKPGQILFSRSLFLAMNQNEIPSIYLGIVSFKGVKNPVKLFRVKYDFEDKIRKRKILIKKVKRILLGTVILLVLIYLLTLLS